jgi:hypothetical protein
VRRELGGALRSEADARHDGGVNFLLFAACAALDGATPAPDAPPARGANPAPVAAPAEADLAYAGTGAWTLSGERVTLDKGTIYADGNAVLTYVYDAPVQMGEVLWVPADPGEGDGGLYVVGRFDGLILAQPRLTAGRPEALALAPDGGTLVFTAGLSGIASLWSVPTAGGPPKQLTNVGVTAPVAPGRPPDGFVAPPRPGTLRFEGPLLRWSVDGADREVAWR